MKESCAQGDSASAALDMNDSSVAERESGDGSVNDKPVRSSELTTRFGHVALIGRPNVGKTTLMNVLVGEKLAAVTRKPHTTRHRIVGLVSDETTQIALLDTPGIDVSRGRLLNRAMNQTAIAALTEADIVCQLVEAGVFNRLDAEVQRHVAAAGRPTLLLVTKVDRVADKMTLLPFLAERSAAFDYAAVIPISALKRTQVDQLLSEIRARLPVGPFGYDPETLSNRPERFRVAEVVREQLMLRLGEELPYSVAVNVLAWEDRARSTHIAADIIVERDSQKGIVIGKGGSMLKAVGTASRTQIEGFLERPVMLELNVRVSPGWTQDARRLREFGIEER